MDTNNYIDYNLQKKNIIIYFSKKNKIRNSKKNILVISLKLFN